MTTTAPQPAVKRRPSPGPSASAQRPTTASAGLRVVEASAWNLHVGRKVRAAWRRVLTGVAVAVVATLTALPAHIAGLNDLFGWAVIAGVMGVAWSLLALGDEYRWQRKYR